MGSNQALSNAFCLDVFDVKTVQLKLRETLHDSVMDRLGKGEFCNEIRVAFLWGFLLALRYAPRPFSLYAIILVLLLQRAFVHLLNRPLGHDICAFLEKFDWVHQINPDIPVD